MQISVIGLGMMGERMARRLLAAGHQLTVTNRTRAKAGALIEQGARWADTPAQAAAEAEVVFTMLAHPEAVRAAAFGDDGLLAGLKPGGLWVDCSTVNPSFSRELARAGQERGVRVLDAPVTGSLGAAESGELVFWVGGEGGDVERVAPLLDLMGRRAVHVGGSGQGSALKLVVNLLLANALAAFAEAVAFGAAMGIERQTLVSLLIGGPAAAPFLSNKQRNFLGGEYAAEFPLRWMHKDLHLASVTAYETGAALPLAGLAKELYAMAQGEGYGDQDFSALYAFVQSLGGDDSAR